MFCRTSGSVVIALFLGVTLSQVFPGVSSVARAESDEQTLRFDEVESFVRSRSPRMRIIEQRAAAVEAQSVANTNWSNPALAYDHEENNAFREWQITLAKRFTAPFAQSDVRAGRDAMARAASLQAEYETRILVAELKGGYVRLQLVREHQTRLDELSGFIGLASDIANSRYAEGELSGVENDLIQLAEYSVDASRRRIRQDYRMESGAWMAEMGFDSGPPVRLSTPVIFQRVRLEEPAIYSGMLAEHPGTLARTTLAESLRKQSAAAGPSFVPGVDVYAGYKEFDLGIEGFVAGIAMDLPLFDRNAGMSRELDAERVIVEHELDLSLARSSAEIAALVDLIEDAAPSLERFAGTAQHLAGLGDTLLFSFREGSLTLDALLGAIQIEMAALQHYYDEMAAYYLNVFRLEVVTGASIVQLGS